MRRVVALIVALAVAGVAFVVLRDRSIRDESSVASASRAQAQESATEPVAPESASSPTRTDEPVREASEDGSGHEAHVETPASDAVDGATEGVLVEGTVVVTDEAGVEHSDRSGSFHATYWSGDSGQGSDDVRVKAGRFRMRMPKEKELGVSDLELDGRAAVAEPDRYEVAPDRPLIIRARSSRDVLLHVVDAATHEELRDVTVLWNEDWQTEDTTHPGALGEDHTVIEHAQSPVPTHALEQDGRVRWKPTLYATAPSHAWGSIVVDYRVGGEATIAIPRGGDLEATIVGEIPPLPKLRSGERDADDVRLVIRLRRPLGADPFDLESQVAEVLKFVAGMSDEDWKRTDPSGHRPTEAEIRESLAAQRREIEANPGSGRRFAERTPDQSGATRFEGLAPGTLIVTLERGHHWKDPLVLAQAAAEIVEGGTTRVTLNVVARDDAGKRVPLSGTVHYADAWQSNYLDLHFEPVKVEGGSTVDEFELDLHDLARVGGEAGLYRFDAGRVLPGRYLVTSYSHEFQQTIETGPAGTDHAEIVIGDPADVVVHVVDADSGLPVESPPKMLWNCKRPEGSTGGSLDNCEWDAAVGAARFRAPAGEIELSLHFDRSAEFEIVGSEVFAVKAGTNEVKLRLRPVLAVALRVTIDGADGKWDLDEEIWAATLCDSADPSRSVALQNASETELHFSAPRPGRYTVRIPKLTGFDAVAPFDVEVRSGERNVATVALRSSK